jgi:hypothetical protein
MNAARRGFTRLTIPGRRHTLPLHVAGKALSQTFGEAAPRSHAHLTQKLRIESIKVSGEAEYERVQVPASCSFGRWPPRKI